jgi:hypothetical protein
MGAVIIPQRREAGNAVRKIRNPDETYSKTLIDL